MMLPALCENLPWTRPLWEALASAGIPSTGIPAVLEMTYTELVPRRRPPERWLPCDWAGRVKHAVGLAFGVRLAYEGNLAQHTDQWSDLVRVGMRAFKAELDAATAAFGPKQGNAWVFPQDPRWYPLYKEVIAAGNPLLLCTSEFMRMPDPRVLAPARALHEKYMAISVAVIAASKGLTPGQADYVKAIALDGIGQGLAAPLDFLLRQPGPPSSGLAFWGDGA